MLSCVAVAAVSCSSNSLPPAVNDPPRDASTPIFDGTIPPRDTGTDGAGLSDGASTDGTSGDATPGDAGPDAKQPPIRDGAADVMVPASCSDGVKDNNETDTDCGGPDCLPCDPGKMCMTIFDCSSFVCTNFSCQQPSCTDGILNGNETDTDCGGVNCSPCGDLLHCKLPTDCKSSVCVGDVCAPASCSDGVKNGNETDVDCGGGTCKACLIGKHCGGLTDCISGVCNNGECGCPTGMAQTPKALANGGDYCIDNLEVTKNAYAAFWAANPNLNGQPAECSWNLTYTPTSEWPPTLTQTNWNGGDPVRSVDWCDALAYCTWAGKRLCGQIGGGSVTQGPDATDYTKDEWYNGCSSNNSNIFPYGPFQPENEMDAGTWQGTGCNYIPAPPNGLSDTKAFVIPQTDPTGNLNTGMFSCQGGPPGVYNMSGDVAEWENSCSASAGSTDLCYARGGSYTANNDPNQLSCASLITFQRDKTDPSIGIRCCL